MSPSHYSRSKTAPTDSSFLSNVSAGGSQGKSISVSPASEVQDAPIGFRELWRVRGPYVMVLPKSEIERARVRGSTTQKLTLAQHIPREGDADAGHGALDVVLQGGRHGWVEVVWWLKNGVLWCFGAQKIRACRGHAARRVRCAKKIARRAVLAHFPSLPFLRETSYMYWRTTMRR